MRRSERNLADPDLGMLTHHVTAALQRTLATALAGDGERQSGHGTAPSWPAWTMRAAEP